MEGAPKAPQPDRDPAPPRPSGAVRVFAGILASRVVGFLRDRAIAHYFGVGAHADVFRYALKGPNLLQNLLGEGTISASFIPIYSRMLAEERPRVAWDWRDDTRLTLGADFFYGDGNGVFGQYDSNDRVWLQVRFSR